MNLPLIYWRIGVSYKCRLYNNHPNRYFSLMRDGRKSMLKTLVLAPRPWSFTMTAVSVTLGSVAVLPEYGFSWLLFILTLSGAVLVHGATNVLNDYFDFASGVDRPGAPTTLYRRHPLVEGDLSKRGVLALSFSLYSAAALAAAALAVLSGPAVLLFVLAGAVASVFYTAGPVAYKYRGLGEASVFLVWGPVMMTGSHFVQHGSLDAVLPVLLLSLPQGLWVAMVILANNLKDVDFDGGSGVRTLAVVLGRKGGYLLFAVFASIAYLSVAVPSVSRMLSPWYLLVLITIPMTVRLLVKLAPPNPVPPDADPVTARSGTLFGVVLIAACLLARVYPW